MPEGKFTKEQLAAESLVDLLSAVEKDSSSLFNVIFAPSANYPVEYKLDLDCLPAPLLAIISGTSSKINMQPWFQYCIEQGSDLGDKLYFDNGVPTCIVVNVIEHFLVSFARFPIVGGTSDKTRLTGPASYKRLKGDSARYCLNY